MVFVFQAQTSTVPMILDGLLYMWQLRLIIPRWLDFLSKMVLILT